MGRYVVLSLVVVACGGGKQKPEPVKPVEPPVVDKKPAPPQETEEDREKKRHDQALAIVPEGSKCLPEALKEDGAPRLVLVAGPGETAVVCAVDTDRQRLLGSVGCWKLDNLLVPATGLSPQPAAPMAGGSFEVLLDDRCARSYCLPKDAKIPSDKIARLAWNLDGSKLAVLVGDDVHLFDASSKAHESTFSIRGDKGVPSEPSAVHFVADSVFVEGTEGSHTSVWEFKTDGSQLGPIELLGGKDHKLVEIHGGSFSVLDGKQIALAEQGFSMVETYEIKDRKRAKLVRKIAKLTPPCKADEIDTFWKNGDKVTDKCRDLLTRVFGHFIGANALHAGTSWLVLLRGSRLGELAVVDPKTLVEKRAIKLPWCGSGADKAADADAPKKESPRKTRAPAKKGDKKDEDPELGGQ